MDFIPKVKNMDEPVNEKTGEENPNFVYEEDEVEDFESYEDEVQAEEFIPQPIKKVVEEETIFEEDEPPKKAKPKKEPKLTKNGKQRKPMSEEHKAKLKQAREKAFLVKKQKAEERKKLKEQDAEEKKLLKLKKQKDIEKLKKEVYEEPKPASKPQPAPAPAPVREIIREPTLTAKDIENAQLNAIMSYEKLRKQRKEEKKKKQSEDAEMDRLREKLMRAKNPRNNFSMNNGFF